MWGKKKHKCVYSLQLETALYKMNLLRYYRKFIFFCALSVWFCDRNMARIQVTGSRPRYAHELSTG